MKSELLAGVDVGSSNCTVGMDAAAGERLAQLSRPTAGACDELVRGVLEDLTACVDRAGAPPAAVGIASMAESGVALDGDLRPLHPLLRWDDPRGADEALRIEREVGRGVLFQRTGVHLAAKTPLARWLWLRRAHPGIPAAMRTWVGEADLIATVLLGTPVTDRTLAGRTGAYNQHTGGHDEDLLRVSVMPADRLPRVADGVAGTMPSAMAGLPGGTPVVVAGHDHLVAAYAAGAREPEATVDSLGTAEAVVTVSATPPDPGRVGTALSWNRHADGRHWALVSGFPGSGRVISWAARLIGVEPDGFPEVRRPTGIVVEPYLDGRGAPAPDPGRRLALRGVTAEHGPAKLAVAVLEAELMSGPALRDRGCCLCGVAACVGAALLAGRAIGLDPAVLPADELPRNRDRVARYQRICSDEFLAEAKR